jgi:hypothetical protein
MSAELEVLFSSAARVQVLGLFLVHPERAFYQREIERETGEPIRAVQREVERLEGIRLLVRSSEGNRVFYRVNPGFPLLDELTALFRKALPGEGTAAEAAPEEGDTRRERRGEGETPAQPFPWLESPPQPALPPELRRVQVEREWDRGY